MEPQTKNSTAQSRRNSSDLYEYTRNEDITMDSSRIYGRRRNFVQTFHTNSKFNRTINNIEHAKIGGINRVQKNIIDHQSELSVSAYTGDRNSQYSMAEDRVKIFGSGKGSPTAAFDITHLMNHKKHQSEIGEMYKTSKGK